MIDSNEDTKDCRIEKRLRQDCFLKDAVQVRIKCDSPLSQFRGSKQKEAIWCYRSMGEEEARALPFNFSSGDYRPAAA